MTTKPGLIPSERIERCIYVLRGEKVILDTDLAGMYGVEVRALIQAVRRNLDRFPEDFMFRLTLEEAKTLSSVVSSDIGKDKNEENQSIANLRSQIVISSYGGRRYLPYAFTEQGVAMLSSVLKSERAVNVNIEIMRAFVRIKRMIASHVDLVRKIDGLEKKYDSQFRVVFDAIRELMRPSEPTKKRKMGFGRE